MKPLLFLPFFLVLSSGTLVAWDGDSFRENLSEKRLANIERNLATVLRSESPYLTVDAGNVAIDLKHFCPERTFSGLIIPLMAIVKDEHRKPCERIVAARALHELRSLRGDFAIKRVAQFTESPVVKNVSLWLAYERTTE